MANSTRTIRVVIDSAQARAGAAQVNAALSSIGNNAQGASGSLNQANMAMVGMNRQAGALTNGMGAANSNITRASGGIARMAGSLARASIALIGLTALTGGLTGLAMAMTGAGDAASMMAARLRIVTKSTAEFAAANATVHAIANETRSDLTALTNLYSKMAMNSRNLGIETSQIGVATRTFAMSLKVSGASAQESASSILQLGQAMASGRLSGDEFRSLAENSPVFMNLLADSMGVPLGALRKLGMEGALTGQQIAKALTDPELIAKIESQFGQIPVTFGDVRTGIGNAMIDIAGALKKGLGIDQSLAVMLANIQQFAANSLPFFEGLGAQIRSVFATIGPVLKTAFAAVGPVLGFITSNLGSLVKGAVAVGAAFLVMKASMALSGAIAQVVSLGVSLGATGGFAAFAGGAMSMFSAGVRTATGAVNTFTVALLANPITAIAVVLTGTIALLYQFRDSIKVGTGEFGTLGDMAREVMSMIGPGLKALADIARSVFSAIGNFFSKNFGAIARFAKSVFGDLDFSLMGFLRLGGTVIDGVAGAFINGFNTVKNVWGALPQIMSSVTASAANFVIGGIESMINRAINGINGLIAMANRVPGVNLGGFNTVSMGRVANAGMPADLISSGSNGVGARAGVDAFGRRVEARGAARNRAGAGAGSTFMPSNETSSTGSPQADAGSGSGKSDAQKQADAIKEYWAGLEAARDSAGLLGMELERHNATLEYRKILGDGDLANARALTAEETNRINGLLTETANRKLISDLTAGQTERAREATLLQERGLLIGTMTTEQLNGEMAVRERMAEVNARALREGQDLNDAAVQAAIAREEATLRENLAIREGNRLLEERLARGRALSDRYARERDPEGAARDEYNQRNRDIRAQAPREGDTGGALAARIRADLESSSEEFARDLQDISNRWRDGMQGSIDFLANEIGGKWGAAISKVGSLLLTLAESLSDQNGGLGKLLGGFGKQFKAMLGNAGVGAQTGTQVAQVGKMLWKQFNETGSQIGGAIGQVIGGPIGSIIGSIGGGIIGGLLGGRKVASGKGLITMDQATGTLQVSSSGAHGGEADAAAMADKVVSGITSIASRLGVTLGGGNPIVAVGKNGGDWRVSPTGGGVTGKEGINFKTEAEAIAFAIKDLIADGILVGLSAFSERLLRNAKNLDAAVGLAEQYEKLLKGLAEMKDPMGYAISDLTKNLDRMVKMMTLSGATAEELAKVQEYRTLKLDEMLKDQLSSLTDFKKELSGEGSGVSAMNRLGVAQSEFAKLAADIAAGNSVDQDTFTRLGQEVFGLASQVFGTSSSQFQAIREALMAATDGAIQNVTDAFDDATVVAIGQQTDAITTNQVIQNDILNQILARMGGSGGNGNDNYNFGGGATNGRFTSDMV